MSFSMVEFASAIRSARNLSTWGPDFEDDEVTRSWYDQLKQFPFDVFKKALATLAGQKYFPACADLVTVCRSLMNPPRADVDIEKESSATYLNRKDRVPFTEPQKRAYNNDKVREKERRALVDPLFSSNEMEYLKIYYPMEWKSICHEISNLSYFPEMHQQLKDWLLSPTKMINEIVPNREFNWTYEFRVKFD